LLENGSRTLRKLLSTSLQIAFLSTEAKGAMQADQGRCQACVMSAARV
jgi:hypothetical protein